MLTKFLVMRECPQTPLLAKKNISLFWGFVSEVEIRIFLKDFKFSWLNNLFIF